MIGFSKFWNFRKDRLLQRKFEAVIALLEDTKSKATAANDYVGNSQLNFGVCFKDNEHTQFATTMEWSNRDMRYDKKEYLPATLHFAAHDLPHDCDDFKSACVMFKAQTGELLTRNEKSEFSLVLFDDDTNNERVVRLTKQGEIQY